jgi:hypothetical protein
MRGPCDAFPTLVAKMPQPLVPVGYTVPCARFRMTRVDIPTLHTPA